jgi:hypothetical protein
MVTVNRVRYGFVRAAMFARCSLGVPGTDRQHPAGTVMKIVEIADKTT